MSIQLLEQMREDSGRCKNSLFAYMSDVQGKKKECDLLCGNKTRQWSTHPILFIKSDRSWAFLERFADFGLERSSIGFITQFKSLPKINWCEFKSGINDIILTIHLSSSQFGV